MIIFLLHKFKLSYFENFKNKILIFSRNIITLNKSKYKLNELF